MTFDEIVTEIMDRLNLTSDEAETRVGRLVNRYYHRATTAIGIVNTTRRVFDVVAVGTIGANNFTFEGMIKITRVWYLAESGDKVFPDERTIDELRDLAVIDDGDTPGIYAVRQLGDTFVEVETDQNAETEYNLYADGYATTGSLTSDETPQFPEDFHNLLVEGPLVDEYKKLEKGDLVKASKMEYEQILSDLKHWAAKTAYLRIRQGERPRGSRVIRDNQGVPR